MPGLERLDVGDGARQKTAHRAVADRVCLGASRQAQRAAVSRQRRTNDVAVGVLEAMRHVDGRKFFVGPTESARSNVVIGRDSDSLEAVERIAQRTATFGARPLAGRPRRSTVRRRRWSYLAINLYQKSIGYCLQYQYATT